MTSPNSNISAKLSAPVKKSIFERQKAEAEAKKAREQAETAAVLEDFVKSFDDEGEPSSFPSRRTGLGGGGVHGHNNNYGPAPGKRHFTSTGLKSGPGSLGPAPSLPKSAPGSFGAPNYGKKRHYDDFSGGRDRDRDRERDRRAGAFSYDADRNGNSRHGPATFARDEEVRDVEELKAAAKPTLHLSSLPPGTSAAVIKSLFAPSPLTVDDVRMLPPAPGSNSDRKSLSAIVTLASETPATDIDTTVSHLQNKYLGFGFNLSISRHLSSAALTGASSLSSKIPSSNLNSLPFGARPIPQHTSLSRAPPPGHGPGRFAPPASYTSSTPYGARANVPPTQVTVQAPKDLKQLRLIHKTVEALLTFGPEFEALLMSRPEIQRDEQWAWLWDSRSTGGVYYRWRLWEILTNFKSRKGHRPVSYGSRQQGDVLFEGQSIWVPPDDNLKFEYVTQVEDLVSDEDYNSSDEEDMDEGGGLATRYRDHQKLTGSATDSAPDNDGMGYLNPLAKTKLVHLLSRLPESNAKLRKGDVARVTGFAIEHAGAGAEEVAALVTRNVIKPFCHNVNKRSHTPISDEENDNDEDEKGDQTEKDKDKDSPEDTTPASLVGLYAISDILSSSASAGVRHAWRYRSLFETQLRVQNVFPILGRAARDLNWGKLKAEKWRRSIQSILGLWEGWCVFPGQTHDAFVEGFLNPPLTEKELREKETKEAEEKMESMREKEREKAASRWRSVHASDQAQGKTEADGAISGAASVLQERRNGRDGDGDVDMDVDGTPMADEDEDDEEELPDANLDGVPMLDSSDEEADEPEEGGTTAGQPQARDRPNPSVQFDAPDSAAEGPGSMPAISTEEDGAESSLPTSKEQPLSPAASESQGRRSRPKAIDFDMFE